MSTPHTYNDVDSFDGFIARGGEVALYMGPARYRKHFKLPAGAAGNFGYNSSSPAPVARQAAVKRHMERFMAISTHRCQHAHLPRRLQFCRTASL